MDQQEQELKIIKKLEKKPIIYQGVIVSAGTLGIISLCTIPVVALMFGILGLLYLLKVVGSACEDKFPVCEVEPFTQYVKTFIETVCKTCGSGTNAHECCHDVYEGRCLLSNNTINTIFNSNSSVVITPTTSITPIPLSIPLVAPTGPVNGPSYLLSTYNHTIDYGCLDSGRVSGYVALGFGGCLLICCSAASLAIILCTVFERAKSKYDKDFEEAKVYHEESEARRNWIRAIDMADGGYGAGEGLQRQPALRWMQDVAADIPSLEEAAQQAVLVDAFLRGGPGGIIVDHGGVESESMPFPSLLC